MTKDTRELFKMAAVLIVTAIGAGLLVKHGGHSTIDAITTGMASMMLPSMYYQAKFVWEGSRSQRQYGTVTNFLRALMND